MSDLLPTSRAAASSQCWAALVTGRWRRGEKTVAPAARAESALDWTDDTGIAGAVRRGH